MTTLNVIPEIGDAPDLPEILADWNKWIENNRHYFSSLESIGPRSGSDATVPQFYMLRTLYPKVQSCDRLCKDLSIDYTEAGVALANSPVWLDYRDSFTTGTKARGIFGLPKLYQERSAHLKMGNESTGRAFYLYRPTEPSNSPDSTRVSRSGRNFDRSLTTESSVSSQLSSLEYDGIPGSQGVEDEEIVNFALVLFGNALKSLAPSVNGDWWPCRSSFEVNIGKKNLYTALVDGSFRVEGVSKESAEEQLSQRQRLCGRRAFPHKRSEKLHTTAIMEVKRKSRSNTKNWCYEVFYQEATEMVAWIAEVPMLLDQKPDHKSTFRRLLFSQDQREVYVTIASYTEKYIQYMLHSLRKPAYAMKKDSLTADHFLTMRPYGPFRVDVLEDMEQLARVILALSYQNFVI